MRQAINENPVVQIAVIGIMIVAIGLLLVTRMGGSGGEEAVPPPDPTAAGTGAPVTGASATGATAPAAPTPSTDPAAAGGAAPVTPAPTASTGPPASTGTVTAEALVPGPGLPRPVVQAWLRGDAVVLLIVRGGATDDRLVRRSVEALSKPGVSVFVARAKDVARYSRITQGVGVNQVPALVVIRPSKGNGSTPQATVSYGFRNSQSVVQAVEDALYKGRDDLPYSPG